MLAAEKLILCQPDPSAAGGHDPLALVADLAHYELSLWQGRDDPANLLGLAQRQAHAEAAGFESQFPPDGFAGRLWHLTFVESVHPATAETGPVANFVMRRLQPGTGKGLVPAVLAQAALILQNSDCLGFSLFEVDGSHSTLLGITTWPDTQGFDAYARWAKTHPWKDTIGPQTLDVPLRMLAVKIAPDGLKPP